MSRAQSDVMWNVLCNGDLKKSMVQKSSAEERMLVWIHGLLMGLAAAGKKEHARIVIGQLEEALKIDACGMKKSYWMGRAALGVMLSDNPLALQEVCRWIGASQMNGEENKAGLLVESSVQKSMVRKGLECLATDEAFFVDPRFGGGVQHSGFEQLLTGRNYECFKWIIGEAPEVLVQTIVRDQNKVGTQGADVGVSWLLVQNGTQDIGSWRWAKEIWEQMEQRQKKDSNGKRWEPIKEQFLNDVGAGVWECVLLARPSKPVDFELVSWVKKVMGVEHALDSAGLQAWCRGTLKEHTVWGYAKDQVDETIRDVWEQCFGVDRFEKDKQYWLRGVRGGASFKLYQSGGNQKLGYEEQGGWANTLELLFDRSEPLQIGQLMSCFGESWWKEYKSRAHMELILDILERGGKLVVNPVPLSVYKSPLIVMGGCAVNNEGWRTVQKWLLEEEERREGRIKTLLMGSDWQVQEGASVQMCLTLCVQKLALEMQKNVKYGFWREEVKALKEIVKGIGDFQQEHPSVGKALDPLPLMNVLQELSDLCDELEKMPYVRQWVVVDEKSKSVLEKIQLCAHTLSTVLGKEKEPQRALRL